MESLIPVDTQSNMPTDKQPIVMKQITCYVFDICISEIQISWVGQLTNRDISFFYRKAGRFGESR